MSKLLGNPRFRILGVGTAVALAIGVAAAAGLMPTGLAGRASNFFVGNNGIHLWDDAANNGSGRNLYIQDFDTRSIPRLGDHGFDDAASYVIAGISGHAIYTNPHYEGACTTSAGDLTGTVFNNQVSSIRVGATSCDGVTLYGAYDYSHAEGYVVLDKETGGLATKAYDSDYPVQRSGFADKASSVKVRPGAKAELWENDGHTGRCLEVGGDVRNLGFLNDRVSSVRVSKKGDPTRAGWDAAGVVASDPASIFVKDATHVFARSSSGSLWHRWRNGCTWSAVEDLGGSFVGKPAVASWGPDRMDVFVRGSDGALRQKYWTGPAPGRWSDWVVLSATGQITSDPAAVAWGNGRYDVFARGASDGLWHLWYDGAWRAPENLGGLVIGAPAVSSWGQNRLDVFVRSQGDALFKKTFDGQWRDWERMSDFNAIVSDPTAVSSESGVVNVMARASDNRVWHRWHNAQGWSVVEHLDGSLGGAPALSSPERGRLDLFARDASGRVVWKSWNDAQWLGWLHAPSA